MKKDIIICLYDMEIGGIERSLINMLENFDYEQFNVDLLIFEHKGDFMKLIPKQVKILPQIDKYAVFRKPIVQCLREGHIITSSIRILSKYISNIKAKVSKLDEGSAYIQMQLAIKFSSHILPKLKKQYDLAISYAWPHDIVANRITANKKIAWIHTDYSSLEIDNNIDLKTWLKFDNIASISKDCTSAFLKMYPSLKEKIVLIENITSPEFINRMSKSPGIEQFELKEHDFNLLSVGRYSYVKGFDMAIKALKRLHDKGYTNIKWYVIGYGGSESELLQLIKENGLEKSFKLLGKKDNPYPYIKACDLYVQPSRYEGKSVTVTEAKILRKPILITRYPTASSQIEHGVEGFICELSVEGLVKDIEVLYLDTNMRLTLKNNLLKIDLSNADQLDKLYKIVNI
ncbi:glycosyltransferase [Metabacillus idriensis]|uniref:glycosyltransferase n=1 Tax=Metabacillus idriensis TaxID=324768 RepID=UPI00174D7A1C|nr:glycosyltransferase [Metabacillus idriensis]